MRLRFPSVGAAVTAAALALTLAGSAAAAPARAKAAAPATPAVTAEEHVLSNGMRIVLVPRHLSPTVAAGWVAHVGSANERPGITGISHLFEHMMFKGTRTIGTRDIEKDLRLIDQQEALQEQMRAEMSAQRARLRRGEITDISKPESKTARYRELEQQFDALVQEQRANMIKNEFDNVLQRNGATMINAFTNEDQTFYFEAVPANKLELWFWMEADRLRNPVFREFYSERDVVYEERRLRTESTPTGKFQEAFDALFWEASPYHWPVVGWPSDLPFITKAQADEYFATYYAPQNLTAILVGDIDPKQALALAERYLGAIPRGPRPAPEVITMETVQGAEKRFVAEAETNPAVTVRWHTVPFVHKDVAALELVQTLLNGPTGRLQRSLVQGSKIATSAGAGSDPRKYEGLFEVEAEAAAGHSPEELEQALHAEIEKLRTTPVSDEELQSAKNRYLTSTYRQLGSNFQLLIRYGVAEGRGTWQDADRADAAVQAVTAADVQRVAQAYLTRENRSVALWKRKAGAEAEDPALAALPADARGMVKQFLGRVKDEKDPAKLQAMLGRLDSMGAQMPPEMKPALDYIRQKAQARLAELNATGSPK
jgi:predicted Zn-dependent peptidase